MLRSVKVTCPSASTRMTVLVLKESMGPMFSPLPLATCQSTVWVQIQGRRVKPTTPGTHARHLAQLEAGHK